MEEQRPNEPNAIEILLNEIQTLLQKAQQNSLKAVNPDHIPADVEKQLALAEKQVEKFKEITEEIVKLSGSSEERIKEILATGDISSMAPAAQQLLKKNEELAFQTKGLGGTVPEGMMSDPRSKQKKKSLSGQERRKKFKRFGSDDKWMPL